MQVQSAHMTFDMITEMLIVCLYDRRFLQDDVLHFGLLLYEIAARQPLPKRVVGVSALSTTSAKLDAPLLPLAAPAVLRNVAQLVRHQRRVYWC